MGPRWQRRPAELDAGAGHSWQVSHRGLYGACTRVPPAGRVPAGLHTARGREPTPPGAHRGDEPLANVSTPLRQKRGQAPAPLPSIQLAPEQQLRRPTARVCAPGRLLLLLRQVAAGWQRQLACSGVGGRRRCEGVRWRCGWWRAAHSGALAPPACAVLAACLRELALRSGSGCRRGRRHLRRCSRWACWACCGPALLPSAHDAQQAHPVHGAAREALQAAQACAKVGGGQALVGAPFQAR